MLRSRLLFAAVIGFAAALGVFYEDHNVGFTILYAMGMLLAVALAAILAAPLAVRIREEADHSAVFKGESAAYRLSVANRGPFLYPIKTLTLHSADVAEYDARFPSAADSGAPLPPARHSADRAEREAIASLGAILPLRRGEWEASLRFPYRGDYRLGVKKLVVTDFLGLFSRTIRVGAPLSVLVYPAADESFRVAITNEPESVARRHGLWSEDYSTVADVQKYGSSDSLRKIHWQLSAARGELIVKNFAGQEQDRVVLFLDTGRLPSPCMTGPERAAFEDKMVSCVAAAVDYCAEARLPVELSFGQEETTEQTAATPAKKSLFPRRKADTSRKTNGVSPLSNPDFLAGIKNNASRPTGSASVSSATLVTLGELAGVPFDREPSPVPVAGDTDGPRDVLLFLHSLDERTRDAVAGLVAANHRISLYLFTSALLPLPEDARQRLEALSGYGVAVHSVNADEGGDGA